MDFKVCKKCKLEKSLNEFNKTKMTLDGREGICHICRLAQRAEFSRKNKIAIESGEIILLCKICTICKMKKPIENFNKDKSRGDGYDTGCKNCRSLYHKKYIQTEHGRELGIKKNKKYRETHPDVQRQYYEKNKDREKERTEKYRQTNRGRYIEYKKRATAAQFVFEITEEQFLNMTDNPCNYCGVSQNKKKMGLDRVNSSAGYLIENIVPACTNCNYIKLNYGIEYLKNKIQEIINHISSFSENVNCDNDQVKYSKKYYQQNKEWLNQQSKKYYHDNKESAKETATKYKKNNIEKINNSKKEYYNSIKGRYGAMRSTAKRRGIEFSLTMEEFSQFWQKHCHFCGNNIETIGLDRIDANEGYIISNVRSCCQVCNKMKRLMSDEEFIEHIKTMISKSETWSQTTNKSE